MEDVLRHLVPRILALVMTSCIMGVLLYVAQRHNLANGKLVARFPRPFRGVCGLAVLAYAGFLVFIRAEPVVRWVLAALLLVSLYCLFGAAASRVEVAHGWLIHRGLLRTKRVWLSEIVEVRKREWWCAYVVTDKKGKRIWIPMYMGGADQLVEAVAQLASLAGSSPKMVGFGPSSQGREREPWGSQPAGQ